MGKRSRQRAAPREPKAEPQSRKQALRERADAAGRVAERQIKARPKAPWDPFPLTELSILSGIILIVAGALTHGSTGTGLVAAGVVLACIGGMETMLREQLAGYRAHSGTLAAVLALMSIVLAGGVVGLPRPVCAGIGIVVFGLTFPTLRSAFIRKSGGRGVL